MSTSYFPDTMTAEELEAHILGTLAFRPDRWHDITTLLTAHDFRHPHARAYYQGALRLTLATGVFEPARMWEYVNREVMVWLMTTLGEPVFTDGLLTTAWIPALKRHRAFERAQAALTAATPDDLRETCEGILSDLATVQPVPVGLDWNTPIPPEMNGRVVRTGIANLDTLFGGGLKPGRLYLVAGRPGMGKSTLLRSWAWQMACQGAETAFITLEVESADVRRRWQARHPDPPQGVLRVFDLTPLPVVTLKHALLQTRVEWNAVFVDYLQLLHPANPKEPRERQVADLSRTLKLLARELRVALVVACQINREAEGRTDHTPRLADLRESGALEADADVVILLFRESYYRATANPEEINLIVAKHREGPTGTLPCYWNPATDTLGSRP